MVTRTATLNGKELSAAADKDSTAKKNLATILIENGAPINDAYILAGYTKKEAGKKVSSIVNKAKRVTDSTIKTDVKAKSKELRLTATMANKLLSIVTGKETSKGKKWSELKETARKAGFTGSNKEIESTIISLMEKAGYSNQIIEFLK